MCCASVHRLDGSPVKKMVCSLLIVFIRSTLSIILFCCEDSDSLL